MSRFITTHEALHADVAALEELADLGRRLCRLGRRLALGVRLACVAEDDLLRDRLRLAEAQELLQDDVLLVTRHHRPLVEDATGRILQHDHGNEWSAR